MGADICGLLAPDVLKMRLDVFRGEEHAEAVTGATGPRFGVQYAAQNPAADGAGKMVRVAVIHYWNADAGFERQGLRGDAVVPGKVP